MTGKSQNNWRRHKNDYVAEQGEQGGFSAFTQGLEHDGCRFYKAGEDDSAQKDSDAETGIFGIFGAVVFSKKGNYKIWGKFKNQKEKASYRQNNFCNSPKLDFYYAIASLKSKCECESKKAAML